MVGNVNGQVIDPGLEVYAGILYVAGGKLRGVSGQVGISGQGSGSGEITPEASEAIRAIMTNPELIDKLIQLRREERPQ